MDARTFVSTAVMNRAVARMARLLSVVSGSEMGQVGGDMEIWKASAAARTVVMMALNCTGKVLDGHLYMGAWHCECDEECYADAMSTF